MKTLRKMSMKKQLIIITIVSSVLPLLFLGVFSLVLMKNTINVSNSSRIEEVLFTTDDIISDSITFHKSKIQSLEYSLMANNLLSDIKLNEKEISTYLYQYLMVDEAVMGLHILNEYGDSVSTRELPDLYKLPTYLNWGIFNKAKETEDLIFYPNYERIDQNFTNSFSLMRKVKVNDENIYLILDVSSEYIQRLIRSVKESDQRLIQFIITTKENEIIYNDSIFTSPISYLDNVFRYDRLNVSEAEDVQYTLDEVDIFTKSNEDLGFTLYGILPKYLYNQNLELLSITTFLIILVTALISGILAYFLINRFTKPIFNLVKKISNYRPFKKEEDDLKIENELLELDKQFSKLIRRIERYRDEDIKKQELLRLSEIKSLMSQINPHFLNNTLDTIKWKAKLSGNEDIANITTELSILLKASMNTNLYVSVKEEISFVESYINLQIIRYKDRISYTSDISEDVLAYEIPKLIIQPIVENSIIHGIEPDVDQCTIDISAWKDEFSLYFTVCDNGLGSDYKYDENDGKIGLKNVENRLKLHYGERATLTFNSSIDLGTIVTLIIPLSKLEEIENV